MASPIAELLFSDYRRRVLGLLLMQPEQAYHVREIARLTQTQPGTLHKELSRLAEVGILEKMTQGNQVSYRANRQSLVFEELASIVRKTSGLADVLAQALLPLAGQIELAWVFGSVASGKAGLHSDIDLLVVGSLGFSELVSAIYPCQSLLGREINPKLYSPDEWSKALSENSVFIRELFEKPVIEIIGTRNLVRRHA
ncbi:nucleotidyltransferase domain-containing protein [Cellvibrio sp. pealriver]|uniref:nucleotidyltransferase domain-containing protein n=1 Tax=Cellvibrio sp. pealriver TaxID=1622269 RepID=UPI00066FFB71|nr:nucleotidyltransferase domain-containing protein [Cellvibrio sp. pealriver]